MQEHHLDVKRTARYCTAGQLSEQTQSVWFVLHGYGQLTPYFIRKFESIASDTTFVVAPEALSRFYLEGFTGRVGATWMTREERQYEIADYVQYLDQLYEHLLHGFDVSRLRVNVLGFSQGTATACRWVQQGSLQLDRLVLWAGYFANGIQDLIAPLILATKEVVLVYGKDDEFLKQVDVAAYERNIREAIPHIQIHTFDGGHTIDTPTLQLLQP